MNESENNHNRGESPQGNNLNQPQWPAGYPMPWPNYPAPPQDPAHSGGQSLPPQGQGYFPWIPYPLAWMPPNSGVQPGTSAESAAQPEAMNSDSAAPAAPRAPVPGYVPWPYPYPPQMMMWGVPAGQAPVQEESLQDDSEQHPESDEQLSSEDYNTVHIREETVPEAPEPSSDAERSSAEEEDHTCESQDTGADAEEADASGSDIEAPEHTAEETALPPEEEASQFTIVSESEPEASEPPSHAPSDSGEADADADSGQADSGDTVAEEGDADSGQAEAGQAASAELPESNRNPIPPANPFITGVTSTPDPEPLGVSRSLNALLQAQQNQEDNSREDKRPEDTAQPLLSDAPTEMPEEAAQPQPATAQETSTLAPQSSDSNHYQQPTPEQLQQTTPAKGPAVPPIPPVPPFQPTSSTSNSEAVTEPDQDHHTPFVMHLPDYLGVDKDIDEGESPEKAEDSAQSTPAHISALPDAPEPVTGPDGVERIGHAASTLPSALTDPYDEKTGTLVHSENTESSQSAEEPEEKSHGGKIVLAIVLVIVVMALGSLLAWMLGRDSGDGDSQKSGLAEAVDTQMFSGTGNVPQGLDVNSSHAGWDDDTYTSCYVDSQEDDSTLKLMYAARRGDQAFTTLCADEARGRMLLSIAYHSPESSDPDDFVLLHAWDDRESEDALGKVDYSTTDSEKNTKSEYRLDQDTLKVYTTSPATGSITDSDLVQEIAFDTVWTREA